MKIHKILNMKRYILLLSALILAVTVIAQNTIPFNRENSMKTTPDVNATIVKNFQSNSKDVVYYPPDSPDQNAYIYNTYTELGWTEINVTETDVISVVTVDYTWESDLWYFDGTFRLQSPAGTSVIFASVDIRGDHSVSMTDFFGETMNGTWILWIEETMVVGGHQATGISVTFNTQLTQDLGITNIFPQYIRSGGSAVPRIEVYNFGTNDESSYSVNLTDGTGYNETINISETISSNTSTLINFPEWFPADGEHTLTASVTLSGDENLGNDIYEDICYTGTGEYPVETIFGHDAWGDNRDYVIEISPETGIVNPIINPGIAPLIATEYINGTVYGIQFYTNDVYVLRADGTTAKIGTVSGLGSLLVFGAAYDQVNDIMYISGSNLSGSYSSLLSVDSLWNCTYIGSMSPCYMLDLVTDSAGNLFGLDYYTDDLFSIDKNSGIPTGIGYIGFHANFAVGLTCDKFNNVIYGTLYNTDTEIGQFGTIDISTGSFAAINSDLGAYSITCVYIHAPIVSARLIFIAILFFAFSP